MTRVESRIRCVHAAHRTRVALRRRGLSILEVLVSMFVLLFGLLGVAAMFPLGQFNVARATRNDRAAVIGQAAFNEIKVRGLLQTGVWQPVTPAIGGNPAMPAFPANPLRFQFDPLATLAVTGLPVVSYPGLGRNATNPSDSAAWHVFVSRDDLSTDLPTNRDLPATQIFTQSRGYNGQYSWMFTVTPSETSSEFLVVSVAVFYRRNTANEFTLTNPNFFFRAGGIGGGYFSLTGTDAQDRTINPGDWCLISRPGNNPATAPFPQPSYRWYQVTSFRPQVTGESHLQVIGPDWDNVVRPVALPQPAANTPTHITVFDSVVAVYEKLVRVDGLSDWSW